MPIVTLILAEMSLRSILRDAPITTDCSNVVSESLDAMLSHHQSACQTRSEAHLSPVLDSSELHDTLREGPQQVDPDQRDFQSLELPPSKPRPQSGEYVVGA